MLDLGDVDVLGESFHPPPAPLPLLLAHGGQQQVDLLAPLGGALFGQRDELPEARDELLLVRRRSSERIVKKASPTTSATTSGIKSHDWSSSSRKAGL